MGRLPDLLRDNRCKLLVIRSSLVRPRARGVRLALEERAVQYELVPIDIFAGGSRPEHRARHPFGKIPAFEHDGFRLYEAGAITRYVDEALPGPRLQPEDPRGRARMNQIVSILDSYAYGTLVWDIYVERVYRPGALGERLGE